MISNILRLVTATLGVAMVMTFVIGLSISISSGFAGFWGGLPFVIIIAIVLGMVLYDYWDECIRRRE